MKTVKWKDVEIGNVMEDGSVVTQLHPIHDVECYEVEYGGLFNRKSMILSGDHLLLCDISKIKKPIRKEILKVMGEYIIPKEMDYKINTERELSELEKTVVTEHLTGKSFEEDEALKEKILNEIMKDAEVEEIVVEEEPSVVSETLVWMHVRTIAMVLAKDQKVRCNGFVIRRIRYKGVKKARCVSTDTGRYTAKSLVHHNSVAVRNIIFHALTHNIDVSIGLVDLKQTEFTYFKGVEGVVGVANEVQEAAELLRIARAVMYKRNKEMAKIGITDIADFKPQHPTETIWVSGRDLNENEKIKVRVEGEEKEMTAGELLEFVNSVD